MFGSRDSISYAVFRQRQRSTYQKEIDKQPKTDFNLFFGKQQLQRSSRSFAHVTWGGAHWHPMVRETRVGRIHVKESLQNITVYLKYGRENV